MCLESNVAQASKHITNIDHELLYTSVCVCVSKKIRGQLEGLNSLLPACSSRNYTYIVRFLHMRKSYFPSSPHCSLVPPLYFSFLPTLLSSISSSSPHYSLSCPSISLPSHIALLSRPSISSSSHYFPVPPLCAPSSLTYSLFCSMSRICVYVYTCTYLFPSPQSTICHLQRGKEET